MAVSAPVRHMTVAEFLQLERPSGNFDYELHSGELVQVTRPKKWHHAMQDRLVELLKPALRSSGFVSMEVAFHTSDRDLRVADVGFVTWARWQAVESEDILFGAPELVIEVLSPSNTASEMYEREKLCLENGSVQFWTVDLNKRQIRVGTKELPPRFYEADQEISLAPFGGSSLKLSEVFDEAR